VGVGSTWLYLPLHLIVYLSYSNIDAKKSAVLRARRLLITSVMLAGSTPSNGDGAGSAEQEEKPIQHAVKDDDKETDEDDGQTGSTHSSKDGPGGNMRTRDLVEDGAEVPYRRRMHWW
jgi:hypothetical protein